MTSVVKIQAHCSDEKQVQVTVTEGDKVIEQFVLQNGETAERYCYDARQVTAVEVLK